MRFLHAVAFSNANQTKEHTLKTRFAMQLKSQRGKKMKKSQSQIK
jgi:hypothetical protein